MITLVYAIKDELQEKFMQPFFVFKEEEATRIFTHNVNTIPIWKDNPADFSLYKLGTFDDETGTMIPKIEKTAGGRSVLKNE